MDISKLKDYEQRLQRERDYYNTLYQNMLCGIAQYAYDEDAMDFIGINPESLRILGYSSLEEFKGQGGPTMLDITYKEDREELWECCKP